MKRTLAVIIATLAIDSLILGSVCLGQDTASHLSRSSFGLGPGLTRAFYSSDFQSLPDCPTCSPVVTSGTGLDRSLEGYWKYRIGDRWSLRTSAGFALSDGTMSVDEPTSIDIDGIASPATIHHEIAASLDRFSLEPSVGVNVIHGLSLNIGAEFGYLTHPTYSYIERLTEPADRGVFKENGQRSRNERGGDLPQANRMVVAAIAAASYELPLNTLATLNLVPSIAYRSGVSNYVKGTEWKGSGLGAALAVEYRPMETPSIPPPEPRKPVDTLPPPPKPPALLASITAAGVDTAGIETPGLVRLRIEEMYEVSKVPLIPYVFFSTRTDTLDGRYMTIDEHEAAQLENKPGTDRLTLYTDILNLIGERMHQHATAKLTLTGCTDPSERPRATDLSQKRAERVKSYLVSRWNVEPKRIAVRARELPDHPSPITDTDGQAENRRVEIAATDAAILAPVAVGDTLRIATPPTVRFHPLVTAEAGLNNWVVEAEQQGRQLARFTGEDEVPKTIDWMVSSDQHSVPRAPGTLEYRLRIRDAKNQLREASGSMNVEQYTLRTKKKLLADDGKAEIENYSLVLFDFNSSELSADNRVVLAAIKQDLKPTSQVTITGYTDRIGESVANEQLALDRAHRVADALGLPASICKSAGGDYPYANDQPEGRFYSRTVSITVRNMTLERN